MRKIILLYSLFLAIPLCFADIPLDRNGNNKTAFSDLNYFPFVLVIMFAIGIMVFIYTYKKETKAK